MNGLDRNPQDGLQTSWSKFKLWSKIGTLWLTICSALMKGCITHIEWFLVRKIYGFKQFSVIWDQTYCPHLKLWVKLCILWTKFYTFLMKRALLLQRPVRSRRISQLLRYSQVWPERLLWRWWLVQVVQIMVKPKFPVDGTILWMSEGNYSFSIKPFW